MNYIAKLTDTDIENLLAKINYKPINILKTTNRKNNDGFTMIYCEKIDKNPIEINLENKLNQFNKTFYLLENRYQFGTEILSLTNFCLYDSYHDRDYSVVLRNYIIEESNLDMETKKQYLKDFNKHNSNYLENDNTK
ncbi:MAG: hypothetical protein ACI4L1_00525 [Christensenellales bacterium]